MRGPCIINCLSFLTIFFIPIWQPFGRVLDVSLPCCAFSRTGGRPWTTISLLQQSWWDLSKAIDCLTHDLLIEKLRAYELAPDAVSLLSSYLSDRVQQVRLGSHTSTWEKIIKGVPQGSILGPLLFNVFVNDIFYFVKQAVIYNYADDNTLSFIHNDLVVLKKVLEEENYILIDCVFFFFLRISLKPILQSFKQFVLERMHMKILLRLKLTLSKLNVKKM